MNNRIRGKEDVGKVLRQLRGKRSRQQVVNANAEILTDQAHLQKIENGVYMFSNIDRLSELLEYFGYGLTIVPIEKAN